MRQRLPNLPGAYIDCSRNIVLAKAELGYSPLAHQLAPEALEVGFSGLLSKWGPGDYRAAVSLWTQGYFGRLLRPLLAYAVLHDVQFDLHIDAVGVEVSDIGTPVRFSLSRSVSQTVDCYLAHLVQDHMEPLIERIVAATHTSERLHWSNASFAFYRAYRHIAVYVSGGHELAELEARLSPIAGAMREKHPLFTLTECRSRPGEVQTRRRVCCIRFKLNRLKKCGSACPCNEC